MVRFKNRYFISKVQLNKNVTINKHILLTIIKDKLEVMHGDFGVGIVGFGLDVRYCNPNTGMAIIRARHKAHKLLGSVLPFIQFPFTLKTLTVKSTMLKAFKYLRNYQLKQLEKIWTEHEANKKKGVTKNEAAVAAFANVAFLNEAILMSDL